jgi:hypothetical protein
MGQPVEQRGRHLGVAEHTGPCVDDARVARRI